jgi:methionine synthase I (cobalamin-dependent)
MAQSASKKKQIHYKNDNVLEALGSVPSGVASTTVTEFGKIGGDIVSAFLGSTPPSGELKPNQAIEFGEKQPEVAPVQPQRIETLVKPNVDALEAETRKKLEEIRAELKALIASLKNLHQEVQTVVSQEVVNPGIYHVNFFEQLKTFIQVLRQQIEDSRAWLAAFTVRKKKIGYWAMYKKHGTTFGLSSERSLATSAG